MNKRNPAMPKLINEASKPSKFCPGCGYGQFYKALALAIEELGQEKNTVLGLDIGCSLLAYDYLKLDTVQTHHGRTIPVMLGLKMASPKTLCIAQVGDGGAYAIGSGHTLNSAQRQDNITIIVINNTLYAMTGGQIAPTSLCDEVLDNVPTGRNCNLAGFPLLGPEMVAGLCTNSWQNTPTDPVSPILPAVNAYKPKNRSYVARATTLNQIELKSVLKKALLNQLKGGFSFVEVVSQCPQNWNTNAADTLKMQKNVLTHFPLKEFLKPTYLE